MQKRSCLTSRIRGLGPKKIGKDYSPFFCVLHCISRSPLKSRNLKIGKTLYLE